MIAVSDAIQAVIVWLGLAIALAAHLYPKTVEEFKSKARMATAHPALFGSLMADLLDQRHGDR